MKRRIKSLGLILIVLVLIGSGLQAQEEKVLRLTLEECIVRTMKNNLSVAIQELSPELAAASLSRAQEKYYPTLSFNFNQRETNSASYSWLEAAESTQTKYNSVSGSLSQAIPFGGSLNVSLDSYKNDTTQSFQTINPRYGSTLRFDFTQPLLQNFGYKISRKEIIIARNSLEVSQAQLEKTLMDMIYSVEQAYWALSYAIDNLEVRRQSLKLAQELLEKNKRSVEIGTLAPIEVLSAQSEVATREADIIQAELAVKNAEDQLKTLMNMSQEEEKQYTAIIPVDQPRFEQKAISLDEALSIALANRPDLRSSQIELRNQQFNLSVAKNQLLPQLNLNASYWSPGISGDRILYQDNNPLTGIVVGTIPGPRSDSVKDALNFKYKNWSIGLSLNIPLSNVVSRATYAQAKINLEQALLNMKRQEQQALLEIKTALRDVEANLKRVQAYRVARELQEQKLAAEEEKLKVGQSTNYTVLMYQRDLANARATELKSIIDYNISMANLERALGVSLKNRNMKLVDFTVQD
ncbi:MAG: TolC family protein [Candidatus Saccharicenans sp.]|uniref:TolC family protein n=1 Tax=Candidatus Saccharicenans sp. TaxID=2819258 RepID=UPI004049F7C8